MAQRSIAIVDLRRNPRSLDELHYMLNSEVGFDRTLHDGDGKWNSRRGYGSVCALHLETS